MEMTSTAFNSFIVLANIIAYSGRVKDMVS